MTFEDCQAEIQGGGLWSGHGASMKPLGGNGGELGGTHRSKFQSLHPRNLTNLILKMMGLGKCISFQICFFDYNWVSMLDFRGGSSEILPGPRSF